MGKKPPPQPHMQPMPEDCTTQEPPRDPHAQPMPNNCTHKQPPPEPHTHQPPPDQPPPHQPAPHMMPQSPSSTGSPHHHHHFSFLTTLGQIPTTNSDPYITSISDYASYFPSLSMNIMLC
jgi:hypothetical protein